MDKYFNLYFEFDRIRLHKIIKKAIEEKGKGFVCVVDGNVLAIANRDETYRTIVNNAMVNICDGSSIAFFINRIYKLTSNDSFKKTFIAGCSPVVLQTWNGNE